MFIFYTFCQIKVKLIKLLFSDNAKVLANKYKKNFIGFALKFK